MNKKIIFFSITSDISYYLAQNLQDKYKIIGTYRTFDKKISKLKNLDKIKLDLNKKKSIDSFIKKNKKKISNWNVIVISVGDQSPVGPFEKTSFDEWSKSFNINYIKQMEIINKMLPLKSKNASILTWAGPATNNANKYYSAYTLSKIALIKSMELLDHEIKNCKFTILGPGWVKTKIHNTTLKNKSKVKDSYKLTKKILNSKSKKLTPFKSVLDCFKWVINSDKKIVGGRNFSVKYDRWASKYLENKLTQNNNIYKLRRFT